MKANQTVREAAKRKNIKLWQIAEYLDISEATMTRLLRKPLSSEREKQVLTAIESLSKEAI